MYAALTRTIGTLVYNKLVLYLNNARPSESRDLTEYVWHAIRHKTAKDICKMLTIFFIVGLEARAESKIGCYKYFSRQNVC